MDYTTQTLGVPGETLAVLFRTQATTVADLAHMTLELKNKVWWLTLTGPATVVGEWTRCVDDAQRRGIDCDSNSNTLVKLPNLRIEMVVSRSDALTQTLMEYHYWVEETQDDGTTRYTIDVRTLPEPPAWAQQQATDMLHLSRFRDRTVHVAQIVAAHRATTLEPHGVQATAHRRTERPVLVHP